MTAFDNRYSYPVELVLGAFLLLLAFVIARWSSDRLSRRYLSIYLVLVGANHFLIGATQSTALLAWTDPGHAARGPLLWLFHAADVAQILDAPALVIATVALAYRRVPAWLLAAMAGLVLESAVLFVALVPGESLSHFATLLSPVLLIQFAITYAVSFAFPLHGLARERRPLQRERLGAFTVAFGAVLLTRLPLVLTDLDLLSRDDSATPWMLLLALVGLYLVAAAAAWVVRTSSAAPDLRKALGRLGLALGAVAAVWLLAVEPTLHGISLSLWYVSRWMVFSIVLTAGIHRMGLLEIGKRAERRLWLALVSCTFLATSALLWSLLAGSGATAPLSGLVASLAMAALVLAMLMALLRSHPDEGAPLEGRSFSVYRAHLELGTDAAELARLRRRLGITLAQERTLEALAEAEKSAPPDGHELAPGRVFAGRYQVRSALGFGGFGRAWLAFDTVRREQVVLKELLRAWRDDPKVLARFHREARLVMESSHPGLVAFRELERIPGGHVLVLQHAEGAVLRERLAGRRLTPKEARRLGSGLLEALASLHALGIAHGDVKPENIVLSKGGPVLLDFGEARVASRKTKAEAGGGGTQAEGGGTEAYMAPERWQGPPTPAADIYAVGVLLWECLAGQLPPTGKVPEELRPVLLRALARDPGARPDAKAMGDALRRKSPN